MIKLNDEDFTNLLTDFYTVFAPANLEKLPNLIEKYKNTNQEQVDAIKMAYIIYFQPKNQAYQQFKNIMPEHGTERGIIQLMESYSRGERIISKDIAEKIQKEQQDKISQINLQNQKEQEELLKNQKKTEEQLQLEKAKEIELLKKELELLKNQDNRKVEVKYYEMEYQILSFIETADIDQNGKITYKEYDYSQVLFPDKKYISSFSVGQRLILQCKDKSIIGVEIVNINDDYIGDPNNPVRLLELKRV